MTIQEVKEYVKKNFNLDEIYKKARKNIAKRIENDDDFIDEYIGIIEKFKNPDVMLDNLAKEAVDAGIDEEELKTYPDAWLSYILRI